MPVSWVAAQSVSLLCLVGIEVAGSSAPGCRVHSGISSGSSRWEMRFSALIQVNRYIYKKDENGFSLIFHAKIKQQQHFLVNIQQSLIFSLTEHVITCCVSTYVQEGVHKNWEKVHCTFTRKQKVTKLKTWILFPLYLVVYFRGSLAWSGWVGRWHLGNHPALSVQQTSFSFQPARTLTFSYPTSAHVFITTGRIRSDSLPPTTRGAPVLISIPT